jgi:SWI/SNF-related matrix-associated actin-dependent regulator 1 of chromatin subfamily A
MKLLNYYGSQDERRHMRLQIIQEQVEFDVILTTYNMVISSPEDRVLFRFVFVLIKIFALMFWAIWLG